MRVLNDVHTPRFLASAIIALWLGGLHRLAGCGAKRLRARDIPALLGRDDTLIVDTETTGVGAHAEVIEVVAIDTTGALRLSALSIPVGPIAHESWEIHGLSLHALHAEGARPWPEVHDELAAVLGRAQRVLAWRADFDARVLRQTAAVHNLAAPGAPRVGRATPPRRGRLSGGARTDAPDGRRGGLRPYMGMGRERT